MNRKLFFGMLAASGMLLTTSCTKDELNVAQSGNEAQVTFSLGLEGGLATRAISDGTGAKKLVYAVYKLDAQRTPVLQKVVGSDANSQFVDDAAFDNGLTETVEITLAKRQTYQVAFWAQNPNCTAYTTTDLTQVGVSYANAANNDENRDAFFKMVEFEVAGDKSIDVVMKRPFAQINVGVTKKDWDAAVASGIEIENSDVVIKNAATSINLLTGKISGEQDVTYTIDAIPAEDLMVDADGDGTKEAYHWLSMSYILVNDTHDVDEDNDGTIGDYRTNLESLEYTFTPENGNAIAFAEGLNNVPVQRNWRTNILGKLLTGDVQFNITIDPAYDDDYIYPNGSKIEQELEFAATFGGTVTLNAPVTLSKTLNVNADMIINLNGQTITGPSEARDADNNRVHAIVNNANLTINGGTITSSATNGGSAINSNGNLTLENVILNGAPYGTEADKFPSYALNIYGGNTILKNVTINGTHGAVAANAAGTTVLENCTLTVSGRANSDHVIYISHADAKVIVKGGTYTNNDTGYSYLAYVGNGELTLENGTFNAPNVASAKAMMTGTGGKIIVKGGIFGFDPSGFVADGYTAIDNGDGTYTVSQNITNANIAEVLNNLSTTAPTTLVLSEDITSDENITIPEGADVTINLNNNTITSSTSDAFVVNKDATLTISGSGKVEANGAPIRAIGGKVIVEGGEFNQTGAWNTTVSTYRYSVDSREGGEIIIKGGTFNTNNGMINVNANSSVVIDGGNFVCNNNTGGTRHFAYVSGKLTINNGEFKGVADGSAGGCFFCGAAAGCEILISGGKFTSLWTSGSANKIFEVYYGGSINVTGGLFNANGGIESFVEANTDDATKDAYPYKAK